MQLSPIMGYGIVGYPDGPPPKISRAEVLLVVAIIMIAVTLLCVR